MPFAEPYAGGAGAALTLLMREEAKSILINDADPAIADMWWAMLNCSDEFIERLRNVPITIEEWTAQREAYKSPNSSRFARGFATFYLNRTNRSGVIVNGGPIGGYEQAGKWKLDARFNREDLIRRCLRISSYADRITLSSNDGRSFVEEMGETNIFMFIDPPYFEKGPLLYLNGIDAEYHRALAGTLHSREGLSWVLTYDDCQEIRDLYEPWAHVQAFSLRYSVSECREGKEVMITPRWMVMPAA
jgi:DNA adenine methylase